MTMGRMLLATAATLFLAQGAHAQDTTTTDTQATTPAATGEANDDSGNRNGYFALVAGWEADTHDTAYGFITPQYVHPIGEKTALQFKLGFNYLTYEFESSGRGHTEVKSPGISPGLGIKWDFGKTDVTVGASLGFKDRERTVFDANDRVISETDENDVDFGLNGQIYSNFARRQVFHALASYNTADEYFWGRAGYKYQLTNADWRGPVTFYLGPEVVLQGNDEINSWQVGGMLEAGLRGNLSLQGRLGYKKSTFDLGDDQTGLYWGVGLYKRF